MPTPLLPLRVDAVRKARWQAAASRQKLTLSEFIRQATDTAAASGLTNASGQARARPDAFDLAGTARPDPRAR